MVHIQRLAIVAVAALLAAATPSGAANGPGGGANAVARRSPSFQQSAVPRHSRVHTNTCSGLGPLAFIGGPGTSSTPNAAAGLASGVLSGVNNHACASYSVVVGSTNNEADADYSFVGAGDSNTVPATGAYSGVVAGSHNQNAGALALIGAGENNVVPAVSCSGGGNAVVAGLSNSNGGHWSFIGAGSSNSATAFSNGSQCSGGVNTAIVAGASNTINGSVTNTANYSIIGAGQSNTLTGQWAAIVSGSANTESADFGFIGGGSKNAISTAGTYATVGGGSGNSANASLATVAGGNGNTANGTWSSVLGGDLNVASGKYSAVLGGIGNTAAGLWSLAAGRGAKAANDGSFVWSDQGTAPTVTSTAKYQFVARASGGVTFYSNVAQTTGVKLAAGSGSWSSVSDRNVKTAIVPLDDASVLAKVAALPVSEWSYIAQGTGVRHVGPMAQDFYAAFGVGEDNKHIATIDEDGIALAAIKGLANRTERQDEELRTQRAVIARKDRELALLERRVAQLATAVAALQTRK
jgi:hypothetical protein